MANVSNTAGSMMASSVPPQPPVPKRKHSIIFLFEFRVYWEDEGRWVAMLHTPLFGIVVHRDWPHEGSAISLGFLASVPIREDGLLYVFNWRRRFKASKMSER